MTAFFGSVGESVVESRAGGTSKTRLARSLGGLASAVPGRLSGLLDGLLPAGDLVKLVLDLRRPLIRPTGEGDLLLEREAGGASLFGLGDPDGSGSSRRSVVGVSSEGREPW